MQPYTLSTQSIISIAVLVKQSSFRAAEIEANYFRPLLDCGLTHDELMAQGGLYARLQTRPASAPPDSTD